MRRYWHFSALLLLGLIVSIGINNSISSGDARQQWEYGRLNIGPLIDDEAGIFSWEDASGKKTSSKKSELYSALGVTPTSIGDNEFVRLYNVLGQQGWELIQKTENNTRIEVLWKRPK